MRQITGASSRVGLRFIAVGFVCALLGACSSFRGVPVRYASADAVVQAINLTPEELATLQSASSEQERNQLQNKGLAVIDQRFHQFVRDLAADRADAATTESALALGSAAAAAFVDNVAAKTNYALFGATMVGAFGIINKNYFYEKTVPALVASMGAARANALVRIRTSQGDSINAYNGVMALADLEEYFTAGTFLAAISEITSRADSDKQLALTEIRSLEVPSDAEISRRRSISSAILAINEQSLEKGKKALNVLGLVEQKTVKDTRLALLRAMRPPTREKLDQVQKALAEAGLAK
jgi:hypothetical protein